MVHGDHVYHPHVDDPHDACHLVRVDHEEQRRCFRSRRLLVMAGTPERPRRRGLNMLMISASIS